jgi:hypothetical protein
VGQRAVIRNPWLAWFPKRTTQPFLLDYRLHLSAHVMRAIRPAGATCPWQRSRGREASRWGLRPASLIVSKRELGPILMATDSCRQVGLYFICLVVVGRK